MKKLIKLLCVLLCAALTTSCMVPPALEEAAPALPTVAADDLAPLGDAGLQHEAIAVLYLPALNGQHLLAFYETLRFSGAQHPAETILRALLAHPGNSRVRSLGGAVQLSLTGANPVEISGGVCTVNLSASALQLPLNDLYTAALAIAATLCETDGVEHVQLLVAGTPIAMDISGCLPLGVLSGQTHQELPVLWEQFSSRRVPVGTDPADMPLTAAAALYFPVPDGGICAEARRLTFPGQTPVQMTETLLLALSDGVETLGTTDMPDLLALLLRPPEASDLSTGGKRITLCFPADMKERIAAQSIDPAACFAAIVYTLTSFIPSVQQVCILVGDSALTSLYSPAMGSMLFPGGLHARADYAHALMDYVPLTIPDREALFVRAVPMPYRQAASPRAMLLRMAQHLPPALTDADVLGLSIDGDTLRINLSERYAQVLQAYPAQQRLCAYAIVNTLCHHTGARRVRFYFGGRSVDALDGPLLWSGEFIYNPGLIGP